MPLRLTGRIDRISARAAAVRAEAALWVSVSAAVRGAENRPASRSADQARLRYLHDMWLQRCRKRRVGAKACARGTT